MGGMHVGESGSGRKKSVDSEIPLVPFIDLLLCCVMFLLVTAVWNQLATVDALQRVPGPHDATELPEIGLILQVESTGYVLASTAGDRIAIGKRGGDYDIEALRSKLRERKRLEPNRRAIVVVPEDGVAYESVVEAMDVALGGNFPDVSISDGASLL